MWESHAFKIGVDTFQFSIRKFTLQFNIWEVAVNATKAFQLIKNQSMDLVAYCAMQGIMVEVHHRYKYTLEQKGNLLKNCG